MNNLFNVCKLSRRGRAIYRYVEEFKLSSNKFTHDTEIFLSWLRRNGLNFKKLAEEMSYWYLWGVTHCQSVGWELNLNRIDFCANNSPELALIFTPHLLTPARLDLCAKKFPRSALRYAPTLLTIRRLGLCASEARSSALIYAHTLLTQKMLELCAYSEPTLALEFAAESLVKNNLGEVLDTCAKKHPKVALSFARKFLSKNRVAWCKKQKYELELSSYTMYRQQEICR